MKTGLILEGGAMRGLFSAGLMDAFLENGIDFDGVIGVSAGAAFGCNYISRQKGRVLRYNTRFSRDKRYCSVRSLLTTGDLYNADFCYHEIPEKLDVLDRETFIRNPAEFYVVCTDVLTGRPVYRKLEKMDYKDLELMRASASMPLVSGIVRIDDCCLLDGGISDAIPVRYFESIGYDRNVVVLTRPEGYLKKKTKLLALFKIVYKKYPHLVSAMERRHETYNETLEYIRRKEKNGDLLVIRPEKALPIGKIEHNADKMRVVYSIGRQAGERCAGQVKDFLSGATDFSRS